jgi:dihydroxyacetone kinase-like protein
VTGNDLRVHLVTILADLGAAADELAELDRSVGDGDLGVTVTASTEAAIKSINELPNDPTPSSVLSSVGGAVGTANPSTLSTLVAAGLEAGAAALEDRPHFDREELLLFAETVARTIGRLGRSQQGDKTVLDALLPSIDALRMSPGDAREVVVQMIAAAQTGIDSTRDQQAKRGRAQWVAERSIGVPDPGAVAYLRLLEAAQRRVVV